VEKRIVGDDEEEGGERAPLLDPSKNVYPVCQLSPEEGSNFDSRERPPDKVLEPSGEVDLIQNMTDPFMIDRVKSFGSIKKEKNPVEPPGDGCIKKIVDGLNMVTATFASQKPLLRGVDVGINSRHDTASNSRG
jgi:hypothetical protein